MVEPRLPGGIMLPSNTKTGSVAAPSSGRQKPLVGQCEPVLAFIWILLSAVFRYCRLVIFFMAGLQGIYCHGIAFGETFMAFILERTQFAE
jgi:hypothetical protein